SEEHTSELQSPDQLVCRLLLEKKKKIAEKYSPSVRSNFKKISSSRIFISNSKLHRLLGSPEGRVENTLRIFFFIFFVNDTATPEIYTLSLHDALPISRQGARAAAGRAGARTRRRPSPRAPRSEEHTSELQSPDHLVCRLLLEKKK